MLDRARWRIYNVSTLVMEAVMEVKAQMWGNSLAIRLPRALAKGCEIRPDDILDATVEGGVLMLRKGRPTLDELLSGINQDNLQPEISFGKRAGKESL